MRTRRQAFRGIAALFAGAAALIGLGRTAKAAAGGWTGGDRGEFAGAGGDTWRIAEDHEIEGTLTRTADGREIVHTRRGTDGLMHGVLHCPVTGRHYEVVRTAAGA